MIPYEVDPSLYTTEPEQPMLDDGFSPPHSTEQAMERAEGADEPLDAAPSAKSAG